MYILINSAYNIIMNKSNIKYISLNVIQTHLQRLYLDNKLGQLKKPISRQLIFNFIIHALKEKGYINNIDNIDNIYFDNARVYNINFIRLDERTKKFNTAFCFPAGSIRLNLKELLEL